MFFCCCVGEFSPSLNASDKGPVRIGEPVVDCLCSTIESGDEDIEVLPAPDIAGEVSTPGTAGSPKFKSETPSCDPNAESEPSLCSIFPVRVRRDNTV